MRKSITEGYKTKSYLSIYTDTPTVIQQHAGPASELNEKKRGLASSIEEGTDLANNPSIEKGLAEDMMQVDGINSTPLRTIAQPKSRKRIAFCTPSTVGVISPTTDVAQSKTAEEKAAGLPITMDTTGDTDFDDAAFLVPAEEL